MHTRPVTSVPRLHVSKEQADEISKVIDEGLRQAFRRGMIRANAHINTSLQQELERNDSIAWNRVLVQENQDFATREENIEAMKKNIERRMRQCYDEVIERMLTDELLEKTRRQFKQELCRLGFGAPQGR